MSNLPYEIVVLILKYLPKSDRDAASEVCREWYLAANDNLFMKKKVVSFYKTQLNSEMSPLKTFQNSIFNYSNYEFINLELSPEINYFWEQMGPIIESVTIKSCDIREKVFNYIIENCKNLEYINVENCKDLFMSGCLLEGEHGGLEKLKSLSLSANQYLTDALFRRFTIYTSSLQSLDLSHCPLQCHFGLVSKFYPNTTELLSNPSESVLTFHYILCFLKLNAKHIQQLSFSNTLLDGVALECLCKVEDLQLEMLNVSRCDQLTSPGILSLSEYQTSLKELHIDMCSRLTDSLLINICEKLIHLEALYIERCNSITDTGIGAIHKLQNLRILNIGGCEMITKEGVKTGLCSEINYVLTNLDVHGLNLDEDAIIMLSKHLPNLESLNISSCLNGATDSSMQKILENLTKLRVLNLAYCKKVSDAGLTGMGNSYYDSDSNDTSPAKFNHRIPLGSRAEEEIVKDAKRKYEVLKMCEEIPTDNIGYSLSRLKCLEVLDLTSCNRVTDVSLIYAMKLINLRHFTLTDCQQITEKGMAVLVKNCPNIEYLDLMDCDNLNDDAITIIVKGLVKLRNLNLMRSMQFTDKILFAIEKYCKNLRVLNVEMCRNVTPELALNLASPRTLHTVLASSPVIYCNSSQKKIPPAPSFFPNLFRKFRLN